LDEGYFMMTKFSQSYELGTRSQIQKSLNMENSLLNILIQYSTVQKSSDVYTEFSVRDLRQGM